MIVLVEKGTKSRGKVKNMKIMKKLKILENAIG